MRTHPPYAYNAQSSTINYAFDPIVTWRLSPYQYAIFFCIRWTVVFERPAGPVAVCGKDKHDFVEIDHRDGYGDRAGRLYGGP